MPVGGYGLIASPVWSELSATKEECVVKCHEAAAMMNCKGIEEGIRQIGDAKGNFVWKDSYVFLMDLKGKMLAHPFQPELTQLDHVLLITDPTDKALFVHFVNLARTVGHGWVEYMWKLEPDEIVAMAISLADWAGDDKRIHFGER